MMISGHPFLTQVIATAAPVIAVAMIADALFHRQLDSVGRALGVFMNRVLPPARHQR